MCDAEYGKIYAIYAFVLRPALLHAKPMRISANFQGILCPPGLRAIGAISKLKLGQESKPCG
jgi:hypothetical protein